MRDALRLRRQRQRHGKLPATWTLRWAPPAISLFQDHVGLDSFRRFSSSSSSSCARTDAKGVWKLDILKLCQKLGGVEVLQTGLEGFLRSGAPASGPDPRLIPLEKLRRIHSSEKAQRWLDHHMCLAQARKLGEDMTAEIMTFIARALDVLADLAPGETIHGSVLGARTGAASKFFRPGAFGRRLLGEALMPDLLSKSTDSERELALEQAGVAISETAYGVLMAGPCVLGPSPFDFPSQLSLHDQAVYLTLQNLHKAQLQLNAETLITVENETPFLALLKEGMHRKALIVLTAGFPNRAVMSLLEKAARFVTTWRHWGDTDLSGIRIARVLFERIGGTPMFWRCLPEDVRRLRSNLLSLSRAEREDIADDLMHHPNAPGVEVLKTVLMEGGWLEQEAWRP